MSTSPADRGGSPPAPGDVAAGTAQVPDDRRTGGTTAGGGKPLAAPPSRLGSLWFAVGLGLALLVVVVVFIAENTQEVDVAFFGAHWRLPLGIDLLLAAALGGLAVFLLGSFRIRQLRRSSQRTTPSLRDGEDPRQPGGP